MERGIHHTLSEQECHSFHQKIDSLTYTEMISIHASFSFTYTFLTGRYKQQQPKRRRYIRNYERISLWGEKKNSFYDEIWNAVDLVSWLKVLAAALWIRSFAAKICFNVVRENRLDMYWRIIFAAIATYRRNKFRTQQMSSLSTMVGGDSIKVKYHHQILLEYLSINVNSLTFFYSKTFSASTEALCFSWDWTSCCYCSPPLATNGLCSSKAVCKTTRRQESNTKISRFPKPRRHCMGQLCWWLTLVHWQSTPARSSELKCFLLCCLSATPYHRLSDPAVAQRDDGSVALAS